MLVRSETRLEFLLERSVEIAVPTAPPPGPEVSRRDNSSSGPRRLGEQPVPLPRASDDKQSEVSLTGQWDLTIEGFQGKRALKLLLNQRGRSLTGTIEDRLGSSTPLHGSVDGDSINFTAVTTVFNGKVEEHYRGTITGNRLRGRIKRLLRKSRLF